MHETSPTRAVLVGVDRYQVIEAMNEAVRIVLSYRHEPYSPAYVHGVGGSAFRIGGICPCAPTCTSAMPNTDLAALFGYEVERVPLGPQAEHLEESIHRVKESIRRGRPAIVWHAFTNAEYDVVAGFDEESHTFLGRGSYAGNCGEDYAEADWERVRASLGICPPLDTLLIGEKVGELDPAAAEREALHEAARHARSELNLDRADGDEWVFLEGIACYERWVRDWSQCDHVTTLGDRYCLGVYRSTHRAAGGFLSEIAPRHGAAGEALLRAAACFAEEADRLDEVAPFVAWGTPDGPDAARSETVAGLLASACAAYTRAAEALEEALPSLGG
jgi:hypothetical protein